MKFRDFLREQRELLDGERVLGKPLEEFFNIKNMSLDDFANDNLILQIRSSILGDTVYFVSSDAVAEDLRKQGFVVYTASELKVLARKRPGAQELKIIHEIKQIFPGSEVLH